MRVAHTQTLARLLNEEFSFIHSKDVVQVALKPCLSTHPMIMLHIDVLAYVD